MELARNRNDIGDQQSIVTGMETRFPQSEWLAEALFSSGNMYLLSRDYPRAVEYYSYLAAHFPQDKNAAAAHWRAGWLSYRQGLYSDAARLFDEQIHLYPDATETAAALYWRARLYEMAGPQAGAGRGQLPYDRPRLSTFLLRADGPRTAGWRWAIRSRRKKRIWNDSKRHLVPPLDDSFPDDSEHLAKAKLLANAGLNDYIPAGDCSGPGLGFVERTGRGADLRFRRRDVSRDACAEARLALRRDGFNSRDSAGVLAYLFPEPYWDTIKTESAKNNLDPYLVASLIRQESEFNPSAISYANA